MDREPEVTRVPARMLCPVPAVGAAMAHITINQYLQQVTFGRPRREPSAGSLLLFAFRTLGSEWAAVTCLAEVEVFNACPAESAR